MRLRENDKERERCISTLCAWVRTSGRARGRVYVCVCVCGGGGTMHPMTPAIKCSLSPPSQMVQVDRNAAVEGQLEILPLIQLPR